MERRARPKRLGKFVRGYLMTVGTIATLYGFIQLVVLLFVEIAKWQVM